MRKLRVGILDLVTKVPTRTLWARVVHPSFASIMPQAIAVWSEKAGHDVTFVCYTGFENLLDELPDNLDVLFVGAFSQAGQLSYAISNIFRRRGCVTVLGGPHARCYPDDAPQVLRLRPGLHRPGDRRSDSRGVLRPAAIRRVPRCEPTAPKPTGGPRALEVHQADHHEVAHADQGRPDDRKPRVPLHVQLLHRLHSAVSTHGLRRDPRRSTLLGE